MSEQRYKKDYLQDYKGILIWEVGSSIFKMELKLADNPVLKKSVEKIGSSIELEFYYSYEASTAFFHDVRSCPSHYSSNEQCHECEKVREIYDKFEANLHKLQIGDTFKIKAALIHNDQSELPLRIQSFKDYELLIVACEEDWLRLPDTIEGIKKKQELEEERLPREREEESYLKKELREAKWENRKYRFKQYFGKSPNTNQIIVTVIGTTIANQILPRIFKYIYHLFFSN